jgi:hypothetical protein
MVSRTIAPVAGCDGDTVSRAACASSAPACVTSMVMRSRRERGRFIADNNTIKRLLAQQNRPVINSM